MILAAPSIIVFHATSATSRDTKNEPALIKTMAISRRINNIQTPITCNAKRTTADRTKIAEKPTKTKPKIEVSAFLYILS